MSGDDLMVVNNETGKLFLKRLNAIVNIADENDRNKHLFYFYNIVFEECTSFEKLNFGTLFARVAFAGLKYSLPSSLLFQLHNYRRKNESNNKLKADEIQLGWQSLAEAIATIYQIELSDYFETASFIKPKPSSRKVKRFTRFINGLMTSIDTHSRSFTFIPENEDKRELKVLYDISDKNEQFTQSINKIPELFTLPVFINLIDVEILADETLIPQGLILEPNYLIDVTAIADISNSPVETQGLQYLLKKFMPVNPSKGLLMGNISNMLLDEIITNPELNVKDKFVDIFKSFPITFANKEDDFVQEVIKDTLRHFQNLKNVVVNEFGKLGIDSDKINIEPSFFDVNHGIQGRLDVLQQDEEQGRMDIVELKSGKIFRPNIYGLNQSHYTQTLLYDLIINSVYHKKYKTTNYILYSQENQRPLRFAPSARSQQLEALTTRNRILLAEMVLTDCDKRRDDLFKLIRPEYFPKAMGFVKTNVALFHKTYLGVTELVRKYFKAQVAFISREHHLAKIGQHGINVDNGLASLWLDNLDQKEQRFSILKDLKIVENNSNQKEPTLKLARSVTTNSLANFRKGDIGVLYPTDQYGSPLDDQVFKCTLVEINQIELTVKLRSKQSNQRIFKSNSLWNIEPDHLDSSFNGMYRSLFSFLQAGEKWHQLWLGQLPPNNETAKVDLSIDGLTDQQNNVLAEMLCAENYYLLWGPPGTGKTSVMLKNFIDQKIKNTEETILVLAYTNRAVDEICQSIESIGLGFKEAYYRIGSTYSTHESYRGNLLQTRIKELNSREEVKTFIQSKRIIVGTLSSVVGKSELFELLDISTVVIDEASQILDPNLCGFLHRFKRFILIGDHKQLPAVVKQSSEFTRVNEPELNSIGIDNLSDSLFERLYKKCLQENWDWAFGVIEAQGRMHEQLMEFPNRQFYSENLTLINGIERLTSPLETDMIPLLSSRKVFIDAPADDDLNVKTNIFEAEIVVDVLAEILAHYKETNKEIKNSSIGIITPYRAQIAQIKQKLEQRAIDYQKISIDTVERYQGGSRDIIILSFCVNQTHQLKSLVSLSTEGIDRKLNVALTRAKERIILIGNRALLEVNPVYRELIHSYNLVNNV